MIHMYMLQLFPIPKMHHRVARAPVCVLLIIKDIFNLYINIYIYDTHSIYNIFMKNGIASSIYIYLILSKLLLWVICQAIEQGAPRLAHPPN